MLSFYITRILAFSILIGGIAAIIRFEKINKDYLPFIYLTWLGCINEIAGTIIVLNGHYNIINNNIYNLVESILYLWFFKRMGRFKRIKRLYLPLMVLFTLVWITDNFIINRFGSKFDSYFNIFRSLILVLLAINTINDILFKEREVIKNPAFLICTGVVIFFTYMVLVEVFWLYGTGISKGFRVKVFEILNYVNFFCNLIYALAILWMRKRQPFTLQF
jgi:hypothetical protein